MSTASLIRDLKEAYETIEIAEEALAKEAATTHLFLCNFAPDVFSPWYLVNANYRVGKPEPWSELAVWVSRYSGGEDNWINFPLEYLTMTNEELKEAVTKLAAAKAKQQAEELKQRAAEDRAKKLAQIARLKEELGEE